jgi:hypothetical protein
MMRKRVCAFETSSVPGTQNLVACNVYMTTKETLLVETTLEA